MPNKEKTALRGAASPNNLPERNKDQINFQALNLETQRSLLEVALELGRRGIPIFPCNADKTPACKHGFKDATTKADRIRNLWRNASHAPLIGIATGATSGLDALDIDVQHGGDKWLATCAEKIPVTRVHRTRSGGWHYLFRHATGLRNSTGRIASGVDVRADGGSLIWWPATGLSILNNAEPTPWPDWLLAKAMPPKRIEMPSVASSPQGDGYIATALCLAAKNVANAPDGQRNSVLNREAFGLLRFVQTGAISADKVLSTLASAALAAGLGRREIVSTLESAIKARGVA